MKYYDKHGEEIKAGMYIKHDEEEKAEKVYKFGDNDLGFNASDIKWGYFFPLSEFDLKEWEIVENI